MKLEPLIWRFSQCLMYFIKPCKIHRRNCHFFLTSARLFFHRVPMSKSSDFATGNSRSNVIGRTIDVQKHAHNTTNFWIGHFVAREGNSFVCRLPSWSDFEKKIPFLVVNLKKSPKQKISVNFKMDKTHSKTIAVLFVTSLLVKTDFKTARKGSKVKKKTVFLGDFVLANCLSGSIGKEPGA